MVITGEEIFIYSRNTKMKTNSLNVMWVSHTKKRQKRRKSKTRGINGIYYKPVSYTHLRICHGAKGKTHIVPSIRSGLSTQFTLNNGRRI